MTLVTNLLNKKESKLLALDILLFLTAFSIPFSSIYNSIGIGALFFYSFRWFRKEYFMGLIKKKEYISILFILLYVLMFVGAFYSDSVEGGFSYVARNVVILLFPITFLNLKPVINPYRLQITLFGLFLGTILILLGIHVNIITKIFHNGHGLESLLKHFVRVRFVREGIVEIHPPYFGLLTVFSFVFLAQQKLVKNKILNILSKALILFYLLLSLYGISSFMSILLLFMSIVFYGIFQWRKGRKEPAIIIILLLVFGIIGLSRLNYKVMEKGYNGSTLLGRVEWIFFKGKGDTSRPENWKSVVKVIKENFFLGVGSDGGIERLQEYRDPKSESFRNRHNAHNQYLETFLRHGFFGLIIFLMIIITLTIEAFKSKDTMFCIFVLFCIVSFITESYIVRQLGTTFFTFYACMFSMAFKTKNS